VKEKIKKYLQNKGWYEYVKYSYFFLLWQKIFNPVAATHHKREQTFYNSFLKPGNLIFDIGAYDGHKTAVFTEIAHKVISVEPDLHNFRTLQIRFRFKKSKVEIVNKAIAATEGEKLYYIHHNGSAFNTLNEKWADVLQQDNLKKWNERIEFNTTPVAVATTTLDALIGRYGMPFFIKIDTEGYEQEVLKGLSCKVPFLSFEGLLPDFEEELHCCIRHIQKIDAFAGYNIAVDEKLIFENFINKSGLEKWVEQTTTNHFEVIVKMGNPVFT
jgi:FkbM family methyltransferase